MRYRNCEQEQRAPRCSLRTRGARRETASTVVTASRWERARRGQPPTRSQGRTPRVSGSELATALTTNAIVTRTRHAFAPRPGLVRRERATPCLGDLRPSGRKQECAAGGRHDRRVSGCIGGSSAARRGGRDAVAQTYMHGVGVHAGALGGCAARSGGVGAACTDRCGAERWSGDVRLAAGRAVMRRWPQPAPRGASRCPRPRPSARRSPRCFPR